MWCGQWELDSHGPSGGCCALASKDIAFCHFREGLGTGPCEPLEAGGWAIPSSLSQSLS